jgi:arylsulfatase A-like enzyme
VLRAITIRRWLTAGLWLGLVDGGLSLAGSLPIAGDGWGRLATLVVTVVFDGVAVTFLAVAFVVPARFLSAGTGAPLGRQHRSLMLAVLPAAVVLLWLREHHELGDSLPHVAAAAATLGLLALLGGALGAARGRRPPELRSLESRAALLALPPALLAAAAALTVAAGPGAEPPSDRRPNVILISIDTLRADHLGVYGYPRVTSPHLDALAAEGLLFETAYAESNWTLPSHASMLTGLHPLAHGVLEPGDRLLPAHTTLAERLRRAGYATAAWVGMDADSFVGAERRFDQGFDLYLHRPHPKPFRIGLLARTVDHFLLKYLDRGVGNATAQIDSVLRYLEAGRREPFFLFLHLYDVHSKIETLPYEAPPPFFDRFCPGELEGYRGCDGSGSCATTRLIQMSHGAAPAPGADELAKILCLYDGGVAYVDHELGRLFRALGRLGLDRRTAILVTADHGEAFLEHGLLLHGDSHEPTIRIPMIVRPPGGDRGRRVAGRRVGDTTARLVDLVPTVLELVGEPADGPLQGRSLWRRTPGTEEPPVLSVGRFSAALRSGGMKYLRNEPREGLAHWLPAEELYDLDVDPEEERNLLAEGAPVAELAELRALLEEQRRWNELLHRELFAGGVEKPAELSEQARERLRALGYVQ